LFASQYVKEKFGATGRF